MFGFLNINKPIAKTSHDVVAILRRLTNIKQIGHTGTLDPLATGVLPIAIGKASRLIEYLQEDKGYIADIEFGKISDTYDCEGNIEQFSYEKITQTQVEENLNNFVGEIEQIPPVYSAIHYKGKRLYELARQGIIPDDIPKRNVFISQAELIDFNSEKQFAKIKIYCSKGTYIRSIVNDLGMMLGTGAIMTGLQRIKSGVFTIESSHVLSDFLNKSDVASVIINPLKILNFTQKELTNKEFELISYGQSLPTDEFDDGEFICLKMNDKLCAIAQKDNVTQKLITKKVFI